MNELILIIGKNYKIVYDDKGFKPVIKKGIIVKKEDALIELESGEILNAQYIVRAEEIGRGF